MEGDGGGSRPGCVRLSWDPPPSGPLLSLVFAPSPPWSHLPAMGPVNVGLSEPGPLPVLPRLRGPGAPHLRHLPSLTCPRQHITLGKV